MKMDTSKEYIEMCKRAVEVQGLWEPSKGDAYIIGGAMPGDKHFGVTYLGCCWQKCEGCRFEVEELKYECVWLPRQDQLQRMIWTPIMSNYKSAQDFACSFVGWVEYCVDPDMEQLWLAFVMYEKYGKKWDDQDWAKETGKE